MSVCLNCYKVLKFGQYSYCNKQCREEHKDPENRKKQQIQRLTDNLMRYLELLEWNEDPTEAIDYMIDSVLS